MKFHTRLLRGGKTATGMEVPAKVVDALDAGKRPEGTKWTWSSRWTPRRAW